VAECEPVFRTGLDQLDAVVFCVGDYGVTVAVIIVAVFVLMLLLRRYG